MAELTIDRLVKRFGNVLAVDHVSLTVAEGEFLTLLGPSGCGKSTTLAAVAGLERADGGRIALGDRVFFDHAAQLYLPPEKRDIGLVFQSYALWPHMTVFANVEFPLKLRRIGRAARRERVAEVLGLVEMDRFADRYPHALSGGQQQRVALARTLAFRPQLLLLDEPLSNLDAKLRERARSWLRQLQSRVGVTTVYVTHDQSEALALSDRIAVMEGGRIVQLATPRDLYLRPASPFVADFIGSSNFIRGRLLPASRGARIDIGEGLTLSLPDAAMGRVGEEVILCVRPEKIRLLAPSDAVPEANSFEVTVTDRSYLGARQMLAVERGAIGFRIDCEDNPVATTARVHLPPEACIVFPALDAPEPIHTQPSNGRSDDVRHGDALGVLRGLPPSGAAR
jgi:iron(III) transport system ATP-binding protein